MREQKRTHPAVAEDLYAEGHAFDFYKAVALLERMHPHAVPVGAGAEPSREPVRFESVVSLAFPPSAIGRIAPPDETGAPARMQVAFMGLAGHHGPLPDTVAEVILERAARRDGAFKRFLDIFNHRLVALMYRVRAASRLGLAIRPPHETPTARQLFAFIGLGTPRLRGRMGVADRSLLHYAGLLAGRVRSQAGLEVLLRGHFGVPVRVDAYEGRWLVLDPDQRTVIGRRGQASALGVSAMVGSRVWDQQSGFVVSLGPLKFAEYLDFLPVGKRFGPLVALTRFHAGDTFDFDIRLTLAPEEIVPACLGRQAGARLGWTSWLGRQVKPGSQVGTVRLAGRRDLTTPFADLAAEPANRETTAA